MTGIWRWVLAIVLAAKGIEWAALAKIMRTWSQEHLARMFWLDLTAPLVSIALSLVAILVLWGAKVVHNH